MNFSSLILEKRGGAATITLNRPEALNAQTPQSLAELKEAFADAGRDGSIGVVILRGAGRAFCAGMDLKTAFGQDGLADFQAGRGVRFGVVCETMEAISKPIIAAVQGHAVTGGFLLAYTADILVAAENAQFMDSHARWGLIPGAGESQRLPRRIGLAKAKELLFTCEPIGALEAQRLGLVNRVVPLEKLDEQTRALADKILANSRNTIAILKSLVNDGARASFDAGMNLERIAVKGGLANMEPNPDRDARLQAFKDKKR